MAFYWPLSTLYISVSSTHLDVYKRQGLQRLGEAALSETADVRELVHDLVPEYHYKNMDSDIAAAEAAASRDFEVTPVNPERFAVHKKIAMYNLGVK